MAQPETIKGIMDQLSTLTSPSAAEMVAKPSWGAFNFVSIESELAQLQGLLRLIEPADIAGMTEPHAKQFDRSLANLGNWIARIKNFAPEKENSPRGTIDEIVGSLRNTIHEFMSSAPGILVLPLARNIFSDSQRQTLSSAVSETEQVRATLNSMRDELSKTIEAAKAAAGSIGVDSFSNEFGKQATDLASQARKWLAATTVCALLTVVAIFITPWLSFESQKILSIIFANANQAVPEFLSVSNLISTKVLLLGVLITATLWCGRIYKALRHQEAINHHRARALETFRAFVRNATDASVQDAILLETTRSIFTITSPGYFDRDDGSSDSGTKIVEVIKSATQAVGQKAPNS